MKTRWAEKTRMQLIAPIVLVEDDPNDAFFVRQALQVARIANPLLEFQSAEQARLYLTTPRASLAPVLFILDFHLSGNESGIDFLRWLRQRDPPLGSTAAMMLTGSDHPDHRAESSQLGASFFLQKPVIEGTLTEAVQALGFVVVTSMVSGRLGVRIIERR
jgi:DNA-binding NarL/FixJ family response regulator